MIHNQWDCQTSASPQNIGNGVEYGVFNWNPATGLFQLPVDAVVDTNGSCGFSSPGGNGFGGFLTRVGNTIEVRETAGGPLVATAAAVESTANALVGAWVREANNGSLLVFGSDNRFLYVETQSAGLYPNGYGQERGCYSAPAAPATTGQVAVDIGPGCRPDGLASYDMNSFGGLLNVPAVTLAFYNFTVFGDSLTFNGVPYKRSKPN
jgi:hypothetical protein